MPVDLLRKLGSIFVGIKDMEAATVKSKTEWRSLDVALEEIQDGEFGLNVGVCGLLFRLLYRNFGCINADDLEALLRQPDYVVAGSAANLQCPTGMDRRRRYNVDKVEVGLANVPRCRALFVHFPEVIFDAHNGFCSVVAAAVSLLCCFPPHRTSQANPGDSGRLSYRDPCRCWLSDNSAVRFCVKIGVSEEHMPVSKLNRTVIEAAIVGFEQQKIQIDSQIAELRQMLNGSSAGTAATPEPATKPKRRKRSLAVRRRMALAQKERWAKIKGESEPPAPAPAKAPKPKRKFSAAGRAAIIAANKKMWARRRAAAKAATKKTARKKAAVKRAAAAKKSAPATAATA